jgi:hypothetical protein
MQTPGSAFVITALVLGLLAPVLAAPAAALEPKRPSEMTTVAGFNVTFANECPGVTVAGGTGFVIGFEQGVGPGFSVPSGKVFVITSWEWTAITAAAGEFVTVTLTAGGATLSRAGGVTAGSPAGAAGSVLTPPGALMRAGTILCALVGNGEFVGGIASSIGTSVVVRGYLTADR